MAMFLCFLTVRTFFVYKFCSPRQVLVRIRVICVIYEKSALQIPLIPFRAHLITERSLPILNVQAGSQAQFAEGGVFQGI
jgi:hypothetical protein